MLNGKGISGTQRVAVGGHKLNITCMGTGEPTVIFEAGGGENLSTWAAVQPAVAGFTRACAYDRADLGGSDSGPLPRDHTQIVSELHALLRNGCLPGPLVLIGHSLGGQMIHVYASTYPQEVAGLVFVDSTPAGFFGLRALLPSERVVPCDPSGAECASFETSQSEVLAAGPLPGVPTVVFVAGMHGGGPEFQALWLELQIDLAHTVPDGMLNLVPDCGHFIQSCRPALITDAIQNMVETIRSHPSGGSR